MVEGTESANSPLSAATGNQTAGSTKVRSFSPFLGAMPLRTMVEAFRFECGTNLVPIRILVMGLPRMLQDVICASLSREEDLEVILEAGDEDGLFDAVRETRADAVVLNAQGGEVPEAAVRLLGDYPRLKIFAITPNGRDGFSVELRPRTHFLNELSAQDLVDEIRDAVNRDRQDPARSDR